MVRRRKNQLKQQSADHKETPSELRSRTMRAVHSRDTTPELTLRKLLRSLHFTGYRIHRKDLPGKPDVAFIGRRKAIFIHGCFWHGHDCKRGKRVPKTNSNYWRDKIARNQIRDSEQVEVLEKMKWSTLVIWECELEDAAALSEKLLSFLAS